ncbi:MAG: hypothetical protein ACI4I6_04895, partial [Hominimerdicola sp.]
VKAGDKVNVTMALNPDSDGVAGFTINLHYDPEQVTVYIPSEDELASTYDVSDKYSVIANYGASSGTIKIVGANLQSTNVTSWDKLALATFTVNSGAEDKLKFWVDVETLAKSQGDTYFSTGYSAPLQNTPFTVAVEKTITTTTTKAATTTTAATTTKATTTTTEATTTSATTTTEETTTTTEATTTTPAATTAPETTTAVSTSNADSEPLYSYKNGSSDYNSDGTVQYGFRLSEYIDDYSQNYDIKVNLNTTGNISGVIGLQENGTWTSKTNQTVGTTEGTWTYENVNPNTSSDLVYMQVYYMKANAEFQINSIEITPVNQVESIQTTAATTVPDETTEATTSATTTAETTTTAESTTTTTAETTQQTTTSTTPATSESTVSTTAASVANAELSAATTTNAEKVQQIVDSAAEQAGTPESVNPNTGSNAVMNVLKFMSVGYIAFSLFVIIYNRATRDSE